MVITKESESLNCPQCGKKFLSQSKLTTHVRVHTGEKPFICSQCDYKCSASGDLKRHERTHTGDKPFRCSYCVKSFTSAQYLRRHKLKCSIERHSSPGSFLQEIKMEPK